MIKVIFFDFDGVIVESVDIKTQAFARLFNHEGKDAVKEIVYYHLENAGVSRYDKFRYIYREILKRPLGEEEFHGLCRQFAGYVVDGVVKAPYVKGAQEFLVLFSYEYKCFIVSATPEEEMREIAMKRGIAGFFKGIYGAPDKKADIVRRTLEEEGISGADSLYIGDAVSDYNAAGDNAVNFIARVNRNEHIFAGINCIKMADLQNLKDIIESVRPAES